ncbi:TPA: type-F conjugative transfer system protein TraW [Legionella pneumophila]|jgi:conjugal transfer pilus assembly protein TraW|nr:type-F conjugative transfer system protein TraW [Legionella pneumophila]MDW8922327.1 type-F conjugative transfer system protein TraW [Legionella pneumophila]HCL6941375.1 type-F conjugative transfer system protein TraW [Legionella pneumophila]
MKRTNKRFLALILGLAFLLEPVSHAKNIGQYGQTFPVREEDIRKVIMNKLNALQQSGDLEHVQRDLERKAARQAMRPHPLALSTTRKPKTFRISPAVTVSHDIWTPDGYLIAKAGTRINPFERVRFLKTLIFFNADDARQVAWVKKHYTDFKHVKFILTGGDVRVAAELFGRIYFDVNGTISSRLQLQHVPSIVSQVDLDWQIKEIGVNDE